MLKLNRLFFALWPDEQVRRACVEAARELRLKMQPAGYLANPERYHLTLMFLGDTVPPEQEVAAVEAASRVRIPPFRLQLDTAGSFRNRQVPWWLAPRETPRELSTLHEALHESLMAARVVPDRMKFAPHLTVLRDARKPLPRTAIKPVEWPVDEFVLLRSRLDLQPVRYEVLESWSLREGLPVQAPQQQLGLW